MTDEQREQRAIKREIKRLTEIYKDIEVKRKDLAVGLIENAAFTRFRLKELQQDIAIYGLTELFSQSETQEPYSRKRPEADLYNTMLGNYLKYIKQLNDMLPKVTETKTATTDGFDDFVDIMIDVLSRRAIFDDVLCFARFFNAEIPDIPFDFRCEQHENNHNERR